MGIFYNFYGKVHFLDSNVSHSIFCDRILTKKDTLLPVLAINQVDS